MWIKSNMVKVLIGCGVVFCLIILGLTGIKWFQNTFQVCTEDLMDKHSDYLWKHPARCISEFLVEPVELEDERFDGRYDDNTAFALRCSCGNSKLCILGYYWKNPDSESLFFVDPLAVKCESCGKTVDLFDGGRDGYDAEIGCGHSREHTQSQAEQFKCDKCGPCAMNLFVGFEYHDDLFSEEFDDFRGREQDLFMWFTVFGRCSKCLRVIAICEFECA